MSILVRAGDGRFLAQSFADKYPLGRKHCGSCKHYRHVMDFSVATWLDAAKTIPHKLTSYCAVCVARKQRARTGHKLRIVYDGQVGTEAWHQRRLAKKRVRYRLLRRDPQWVQARRDYFNRRNRLLAYARWAPPPSITDPAFKSGSGSGQFSAAKFVAYLDQWITEQATNDGDVAFYLNGFPLGDNDGRRIRSWRSGEAATVKLSTADKWAIRFDLPLWEIEEAAKLAA